MTLLLSFGFLVLLLSIVVWKAFAADRVAKKKAKEQAARRAEQEQRLLEKVQKLKKRTDLDRANAAVDRDPKRAAKVVSKMMKK